MPLESRGNCAAGRSDLLDTLYTRESARDSLSTYFPLLITDDIRMQNARPPHRVSYPPAIGTNINVGTIVDGNRE